MPGSWEAENLESLEASEAGKLRGHGAWRLIGRKALFATDCFIKSPKEFA